MGGEERRFPFDLAKIRARRKKRGRSDKPSVDAPSLPEPLRIQKIQTMKKLPDEDVARMSLGATDRPVLYPVLDESTGRDGYVLQLPNAVFLVPRNHPKIQELQLHAADQVINALQARTPVELAAAIKSSLRQAGFKFEGGPLDLLQFSIQAMEKVIEVNQLQARLNLLDAAQTGLSVLQQDLAVGPVGYWLLPPHRRMNVALLSELLMVKVAQELSDDETVAAAGRMKDISKALAERKAEITQLWAEHFAQTASSVIKQAGGATKGVLTDIATGIMDVSNDSLRTLLQLTLGEEAPEEGAIEALLRNLGTLGDRIREEALKSGISLRQLLTNLFKGGNGTATAAHKAPRQQVDLSPILEQEDTEE